MTNQTQLKTKNPHEILGLPAEAPPEDIRKAYLAKIRQFPPDRAPEAFEQIRDAYEQLSDPHQRAKIMLTADPSRRLTDVLKTQTQERHFIGPDEWLEVLKTKTRQ